MGTAWLSPNSLRAFSEDYIAGKSLRTRLQLNAFPEEETVKILERNDEARPMMLGLVYCEKLTTRRITMGKGDGDMKPDDPYELNRFLRAQEGVYERAQELKWSEANSLDVVYISADRWFGV
jgi:hypothetical protein